MRRADAIELLSILCIAKVKKIAEMKIEAKPTTFVCTDTPLNFDNSANRIAFDPASARDKKGNEGSLKRCLYLRERTSVE
jgi:hypothetical protein